MCCENINILKLPYSGELCKSCNSIIINNDFDKHLTKENFNDIMKVLAENYNGDITKNPKWVYTYKFINVDDKRRPPCKHLENEEIEGTVFCISCGETLYETLQPPKISCYTDHHIEKLNNKHHIEKLNNKQLKAFKKIIYEFQGMYDETVEKIPQELLFDYLDEMFPDRSKVTKKQLRDTLKKTKYKRFIKVVHWIHHVFTGVPKNDINMHMEELIEDFDYLYVKFRNFKKIPFDPQLILFVLLESYDCDHDRSEFHFKNYSFEKEEELVEILFC